MNRLTTNITVNSVIDSETKSIGGSFTQNLVSNSSCGETQDIGSSGWTALSSVALPNILGITIFNDNLSNNYTASVIQVATGSAGQNPISVLLPGAYGFIPWSGSLNGLYAKVIGGVAVATPVSGTLQWMATPA